MQTRPGVWSMSRGMSRASSALITATERLFYASHRRANTGDWLAREIGPQTSTDGLLDFGGGDGRISQELRSRIGGRYLVADISEPSLRNVPFDPALVPIRISPSTRLPIRDGSLAAAFLVDVLHHVHRQRETLTELIRCLRPGGVLSIVEFDRRHLATRIFGTFARMGGRMCQFHTPDELAALLQTGGRRVTVTRLDGLRYGVSSRL